jgi:hypothetical protein
MARDGPVGFEHAEAWVVASSFAFSTWPDVPTKRMLQWNTTLMTLLKTGN